MFCKVGEEETQVEAQCIQVLDAVEGEVLEIALVNEGEYVSVGVEKHAFIII